VWWDTAQAHFAPGVTCAASPESCAATTVPAYTHVNAFAELTPGVRAYILVGRNSCGVAASSFSNRVGAFTFGLAQ
jgi:hypothetical protein